MKLSFHGAARAVTGTKHLVTFADGSQVLLDCGLFQGMGKKTDGLNRKWGFEAPKVPPFYYLMHI
jgi:metallo-beta-lactamase family protein